MTEAEFANHILQWLKVEPIISHALCDGLKQKMEDMVKKEMYHDAAHFRDMIRYASKLLKKGRTNENDKTCAS